MCVVVEGRQACCHIDVADDSTPDGVTAWSAEMKGELSRQCISQEFVDRSIDMHRSSLLSEATHALQRR